VLYKKNWSKNYHIDFSVFSCDNLVLKTIKWHNSWEKGAIFAAGKPHPLGRQEFKVKGQIVLIDECRLLD